MRSLLKVMTILVLSVLFTVACLPATAAAATWTNSSVVSVPYDQHNVFMLFAAGNDAQVSYSFTVQLGGRVDILVMDQANYDAYRASGPFSYLPGSTLDALSGANVVLAPVAGEVYYMVIDNTFEPTGGADPTGSVTVSCNASVLNATLPEQLLDFIWIIGIGALVVFGVFIIIIYFIFFRKPKQYLAGRRLMNHMRKINIHPERLAFFLYAYT